MRRSIFPREKLTCTRREYADAARVPLAAGATPEEIMEMLKLCISRGSGRTAWDRKVIKTHNGRMMYKMQVRSTLALAQLMIRAGLVPKPQCSSKRRPASQHASPS
jgi:hypothetical protein